jgi:hypothetical protein
MAICVIRPNPKVQWTSASAFGEEQVTFAEDLCSFFEAQVQRLRNRGLTMTMPRSVRWKQ